MLSFIPGEAVHVLTATSKSDNTPYTVIKEDDNYVFLSFWSYSPEATLTRKIWISKSRVYRGPRSAADRPAYERGGLASKVDTSESIAIGCTTKSSDFDCIAIGNKVLMDSRMEEVVEEVVSHSEHSKKCGWCCRSFCNEEVDQLTKNYADLETAQAENSKLKSEIEESYIHYDTNLAYWKRLARRDRLTIDKLEEGLRLLKIEKSSPTEGFRIWSKSTGLGPYIILGRTIQTIGALGKDGKTTRVEAWVCRNQVGVDQVIPFDDAVAIKPRHFALFLYLLQLFIYYVSLKKIK